MFYIRFTGMQSLYKQMVYGLQEITLKHTLNYVYVNIIKCLKGCSG